MKAKFHLTAEPGLTGFKLWKPGEGWEQAFRSIPNAVRYVRAVASKPADLVIHAWNGEEVGHVAV
jgi:hypothetical protein